MSTDKGFELIIDFTGLCAFVPRRGGGKVWVLLVDEGRADRERERGGLRAHHAAVHFDLGYLLEACERETKGIPAQGQGIWYLKNYDLSIVGSAREEDAMEAPRMDVYGLDREEDEEVLMLRGGATPDGSFVHIASLEKACSAQKCQGGGELDRRFLAPTLDEDLSRTLAARINLDRGVLQVHNYGQDQGIVVWRFRSFNTRERRRDHRQVVASSVRATIPVTGDYVSLCAKSLESGDPVERLDLFPTDGRVVIAIKNEESDQFLKDPKPIAPSFKKPRRQDRLFESFYKLSANPPRGKGPIPVADYALPVDDPGGADSSPPCSPARFQPTREPRVD